jgi:hypothetical protein
MPGGSGFSQEIDTMATITHFDDIIDVRDIIARVEELQETRDALREEFDAMPENAGVDFDHWVRNQEGFSSEDADELQQLESFLADLQGMGGDEQWRGDWYPVTLVRDSYFKDYAQELADDIGAIPAGASWPCTCIDWDQAARELRMDYSSVEFDGVTYWTR